MRVAELSPRDVDELFGLREVLERFAVQIAAQPSR
jgi:DNA-binding GntR family transcriptional regulator